MDMEKLGEFYRNYQTGHYCFICNHCGLQFGTFTDIDVHICIEHEYKNVKNVDLLEIKLEPIQPDEDNNILLVSDALTNYVDEIIDEKDHLLSDAANKTITPLSSYECDICHEIFSEKLQIVKHMRASHSKRPVEYKCEICNNGFIYSNKTSLNSHITAYHNDRNIGKTLKYRVSINCEMCDVKLIGKQAVVVHNRLMHPDLKEFKCNECGNEFATKYRLENHIKRQHPLTPHIKQICEICKKSFSDKNSLKVHLKIHAGQRDYSCDVCNKKFTHSSYVKVHKRTHTGEKPFQCSVCGFRFNSTAKLNRHTKLRHTTLVKPHKCSHCDKMFLTEYLRNKHEFVHSGIRSFHCTICAKSFASHKVLKNHALLHQAKRFKCKFCDMTFAQSPGRRAHEKNKHLNILI